MLLCTARAACLYSRTAPPLRRHAEDVALAAGSAQHMKTMLLRVQRSTTCAVLHAVHCAAQREVAGGTAQVLTQRHPGAPAVMLSDLRTRPPTAVGGRATAGAAGVSAGRCFALQVGAVAIHGVAAASGAAALLAQALPLALPTSALLNIPSPGSHRSSIPMRSRSRSKCRSPLQARCQDEWTIYRHNMSRSKISVRTIVIGDHWRARGVRVSDVLATTNTVHCPRQSSRTGLPSAGSCPSR